MGIAIERWQQEGLLRAGLERGGIDTRFAKQCESGHEATIFGGQTGAGGW